ncbi:MAG: L-ribulose-5-phosphate 3-epimerase [Firmicutes bacterium]|nr:L-ribulose-5-phosphate 3-epimerase [Bacillota bacterium]
MGRDYTLGLYEKSMPRSLSLGEKLAAAGACGFDFLEVSIDETDEKLERLSWGAAKRREAADASREAGVPLGSICLSAHRKFSLGNPDPAGRARALDIAERAIGLACDWGVRLIQLAGYDVYYEPGGERTRAFFRENLGKCVGMAAASGVVLAFETMETPFMDTVKKAMAYVDDMRSPWLQIYPDLGNLTNAALLYGHGVADDLAAGKGHIAALHLKESAPGRYRDVPYGSGHVDFAAGIKAARELGVRRFVGEFWDMSGRGGFVGDRSGTGGLDRADMSARGSGIGDRSGTDRSGTGGEDWRGRIARAHGFLRGFLDAAADS